MDTSYDKWMIYDDWLVVDLPFWKIWVRQLGWWTSQLNGKKIMFQTTNQISWWPNAPCFSLEHLQENRENISDGEHNPIPLQIFPPFQWYWGYDGIKNKQRRISLGFRCVFMCADVCTKIWHAWRVQLGIRTAYTFDSRSSPMLW